MKQIETAIKHLVSHIVKELIEEVDAEVSARVKDIAPTSMGQELGITAFDVILKTAQRKVLLRYGIEEEQVK